MSKHKDQKGGRGKPFSGQKGRPEGRSEGRPSGRPEGGRPEGRKEGRPEARKGARPNERQHERPKDYAKDRPGARPHERPKDRAAARPAERQFERPKDHPIERPMARPPERQNERPAERLRDRPIERPIARHIERPRERRGGSELWLYGHHAVAAALANPLRKVLRLLATAEAAAKLAGAPGVPERALGQLRAASRAEIDQQVGTEAVHQGVAVLVHPLEFDLTEVLAATTAAVDSCIVVLDQVTDPHNVGAILRSAAAFGAAAVIAPDRHAADESGAMAKSASGALDKIPYIKAGNLNRAIEIIKEHQYWLVGLAADAPQDLADVKLDGRIALVLGAEGEGLRRLVSENCDHLARLPMAGDMESLNVSNAAAVSLYERARQITGGKRSH